MHLRLICALGLLAAVSLPFHAAHAEGADAPPKGSATTPEGPSSPPEESAGEAGPRLDLGGLEDPAYQQPEEAVGEPSDEAVEESFEERLDPDTPLAGRASSILDRTTLGGYGEHSLVVPETGVTTFVANRFVLFVYSQISQRISVAAELEYEFGGSPVKKNGIVGFGEALTEFVVADLKVADWLKFRAGIVLVPFGWYNLRHDSPGQELPERPIAYTSIVPTTWFESGAGFLGTFDLGDGQKLNYEVYAINGLDAGISDGLGMFGARGSNWRDNNDDKGIVGRLAWSPFLGLEVGASGYTGAYDQLNNRVNMVNGDVFWRLGQLDLHGEAVWAFIDPGFVQGFADGSPANTRSRIPTGMNGYYGQADYHFRVEPFFRALPDGWHDGHFTASLRYEEKNTDDAFVTAAGDVAKATVGLNFRPRPPYVLKNAFSWQLNGASGDQPHLWSDRFFSEGEWKFVSSVAYLF